MALGDLFTPRPHIEATLIQSLWRGYKTRNELKEKHKEEIAAVESRWREYDEQYRISVICQNLMVHLKKSDRLWDATQTPFYVWMLEDGGPWIAAAEEFMQLRGWVRPKNYPLKMTTVKKFIQDALQQCDASAAEERIVMALMDSFVLVMDDAE